MLSDVNSVALVLDPDYGEKIEALAPVSSIWIVDTPPNRTAVSKYWAKNPKHKVETGITIFKASDDASDLERCLSILDTIDLHHGEFSSNSPYSMLEVIGLPLSDEVKSAIEGRGFRTFEATVEGFQAKR